ncbi:MAG: EAL domain-containing protein [Pseudomonadota bacterium]
MISPEQIRRARVLVVDDQQANVDLLDYLLANSGYTRVDSTLDPTRVAAMHAEARYDLIILDLQMPGMDGFGVMRALAPLEREDYLPVLVVTADLDQTVAALEAGARDFVTKPFDPVEVLTRIRNMLEVRLMHRQLKDHGALLEATVRARTVELQRFRSAMDATADAIFLIDAGSKALLDISDGACRMLGFSRAQLLGADPCLLGLANKAELEREADPARAGARAPTRVAATLPRFGREPVPVEIDWQLQVLDGSRILIGVARDVSERQAAQRRLHELASYDSLTGLPNRTLFHQTLNEAVALAGRGGGRVAVLFIALDRFKTVNDSLGAELGDELLRQFSSRLVGCAPARDTVGRLGGDEFALILSMPDDAADAAAVANDVRQALRTPFVLRARPTTLSASIGIAVYPDDSLDAGQLVMFANTAMAQAKEAGRDGYRFFTAGMNVQVLARLDLEQALRQALENGELLLYYQPKASLDTGSVSGVEALLRWQRPGHGLVLPSAFVPVMEETGLIVRVGAWVIDAACRQIAQWSADGAGDVKVAVNVSGRQFAEGDLEADIRASLERHAIAPALLELELTEGSLMTDPEHTIEVLTRLKALGISIAIDDFGTGYSSLAYLKRFPIDKLKIDIAFVRDVTTNPDDAAIALAIIGMAHSLHMRVIAEGVESQAQQAYLRRQRCDEIQGFHLSHPLPAGEVAGMLLANREARSLAPGAGQARQTLLLVDADGAELAALAALFGPDDYQVLTALSAEQGFEMLALHQVHVILCEQRLPGMSGIAFLSKVKTMYPAAIRMILSAETDPASMLESINRGALYRYYTKPWTDAELRDNVRRAFHHFWLVHGTADEPYGAQRDAEDAAA